MTSSAERPGRLAACGLALAAILAAQGCGFVPPDSLGIESASARSRPRVTTDWPISDAEMERFLLEGTVITQIPTMIPSTTNPMPVELDWNGEIRKAIFKYAHFESPDSERAEGEADEPISPDSYRYEIAAYRIDRLLGLQMVPVTVLRTLSFKGALIKWVSGALTEPELRALGTFADAEKPVSRQRAVMDLFDALILNLSRRESDQLIELRTWKLHLIDHSRAFGTSTTLPTRFTSRRASLPRALLESLKSLEEASLKTRLDGLLADVQIAAMLKRRDAIVKKIERDLEAYGTVAVFQE